MRRLLFPLAALLGWGLGGPNAQALTDPTLPPAALRASAPARAAAAPAVPRVPRVQGLRPGESALIDGRLRRVGERWDGHHLLCVEARAAWLRDPEGREVRLSLIPPTTPSNPAETRR